MCEDLNCVNYYNYNQSECIDIIPEGYYCNDTFLKTIDECHPECRECKSKDTENNMNCISCPNETFLFLGNCVSSCQDGYFRDENDISKKICKCPDTKCFHCSIEAYDLHLCDSCNDDYIISSQCKIFDIDLYKIKKEELDFMSGYQIIFDEDNCFNGLVAWFNVYFNKGKKKVVLPTGPWDTPTHWKQTVFYIEDDVLVKKGDKLWGNIAVIKDKKNFRFINIKISYHFDEDDKVIVQQYKIT